MPPTLTVARPGTWLQFTPQVYLDFGLAVPLLSIAGMYRTIQTLLELAPASKLMYSSDAHLIPELYYLAAKWGREILGRVLDEAIRDGDLDAKESEDIAFAVLGRNAHALYPHTAGTAI